ncbi:MAG: endonuclease/exonuclease/phosphatase family protein [Planctomycetota bacterium]
MLNHDDEQSKPSSKAIGARFSFTRMFSAGIVWLLIALGLTGSLVTLASFGAAWDWRLDLLVNMRTQLILGAAIVVGLLAIMKRWKPAMLFSLFLLVNLADVLPLYLSNQSADSFKNEFVLVSANVWTGNNEKAKYIASVREVDADVLVFLEVDQAWANALQALSASHPYQFVEPLENNFGVALFSRYPIEDARAEYFAGDLPTVVATVRLSERDSVLIVGTHTVPPKNRSLFEYRNAELEEIAIFTSRSTIPTVVCGDFNATPWSPAFKSMVRKSNLRDARRGFGLNATWPQTAWPIKIPIDHILVSQDIVVGDFSVGPHSGSDHRMVIGELGLGR